MILHIIHRVTCAMIPQQFSKYKDRISNYFTNFSWKSLISGKQNDHLKVLLYKIYSPAIVVNEYGILVEYNEEFAHHFPKLKREKQSSKQFINSPIDKCCDQRFYEKLIQLIQFMQENDQRFVFKEHFFVIDDMYQKVNYDILSYQIKNQAKSPSSDDEKNSLMHPNLYTIILNPRHENQKCSENFSHEQRIQTLGYLSGAISHDFNNILTAISGFAEIVLAKMNKSDETYESIEQIQKSVRKATTLVNRLLAFARKQVLNFEVIDVNEKFKEINELMQRLIAGETELAFKIPKKLYNIEVDPVQFEQIILNLILNAKQAIDKKENGRIQINISNKDIKNGALFQKGYFNPSNPNRLKPGKYLKISVKDNGCGIKRSFLHQIFDPFFSTRKKKNGTGLGLSTVFGIIKQSKGHILVNAKEKYTEFIILFPKSNKTPSPQVAKHSMLDEDSFKAANNNAKILVVEDEDSIRALFSKAFKECNYNVIMFENADEAVAHLEKNKNYDFDIVLTDVVMPGMSGPEFLKYFRKHNDRAKEILISGYGEDVLNSEFAADRKFIFLSKPFSIKKLMNKIASALKEKV